MQDNQAAELRKQHRQHIRNIAHTAQPNHGTALAGTILVGVNMILEHLEHQDDLMVSAIMEAHPNFAADVAAFHEKFGIHYYGPARFLPDGTREFREKFGREELTEYEQAKTLEEKLDAGLDQIYIILGNLHLHGFTPEQINEGWRRVQEANMQKVKSDEKNPSKRGANGLDIVKPEGWKAPDHSDLIAK